VSFAEDTQDRLQQRLTAAELDLLVVYDLDLSPALARTAIAHRAPFALVAAEHPIAARREIELAELADEPMVLLDAPPSSAHALGLCADAGFTPRVRFRTGNIDEWESEESFHAFKAEAQELIAEMARLRGAPVPTDSIWRM